MIAPSDIELTITRVPIAAKTQVRATVSVTVDQANHADLETTKALATERLMALLYKDMMQMTPHLSKVLDLGTRLIDLLELANEP